MLDHVEIMEDCLRFINSHDNYLVTCHLHADGDAYGSMLAMSLLLDELDKNYRIIIHDADIDERYSFIKNWNKIESFANVGITGRDTIEAVIMLDVPGQKRLGDMATWTVNKEEILKIDHHPAEDDYMLNFVDTSCSSASAMVYELAVAAEIEIGLPLAEAIYTGIVYDTGRLSYSNTRDVDLKACAHLVSIGVEPKKITNSVFMNNQCKTLQVFGKGLCNIKQYANGKITIIYLTLAEMGDVEQPELEELAAYSVSVRGTEIGVYIRQTATDLFKLSLRSKNNADVRSVAQQFEGGGHYHAAGCQFRGNYIDLLKALIPKLEEVLLSD